MTLLFNITRFFNIGYIGEMCSNSYLNSAISEYERPKQNVCILIYKLKVANVMTPMYSPTHSIQSHVAKFDRFWLKQY